MTAIDAERFFDSYRDAFNRADAAAVCAHYALPCVFSQGSSPTVFASARELLNNNERLIGAYRDDGFERAEHGEPVLLPLGDDHAVADLPWTLIRKAPKPPLRFRTAYSLRRQDGGWRIWAVAVYGEIEAFAADRA
jgi:ketosteroid isomerase-like protein